MKKTIKHGHPLFEALGSRHRPAKFIIKKIKAMVEEELKSNFNFGTQLFNFRKYKIKYFKVHKKVQIFAKESGS